MDENKQTNNLIISPQKRKYKHIEINSIKKGNTTKQNLKKLNLTSLEETIDTFALNKIMFKSTVTVPNTKNNFYNKRTIFDNLSKTLIRDNREKLFYLRDKVLNNTISPKIWNYINKKKVNRNFHYSYNNIKLNAEKKVKILENEKIAKFQERINRKNDQYKNFLSQKKLNQKEKSEYEKLKNEKRKIKIKMYKLIQKHGELCESFEKKNESYNTKFINYLNSKKYINSKKHYNSYFHFSKNDLSKAHDPYKQYMKTNEIAQNSINLKEIFSSLNNKDKRIIEKEPDFFFKNNKILEVLQDVENKPLITTLREEEEIESMIKNKIPKKEIDNYKSRNDTINQKIDELDDYRNNLLQKDVINKNNYNNDGVSQLLYKNTIKTIKDNEYTSRTKSNEKNIKEIFNDELKNCERALNRKNLLKLINNKKSNNPFDKKIKFVTKLNALDNNNKRLDREEIFQTKRKKIINTEDDSDSRINRLKTMISNVYSSIQLSKDDKK